MMNSATDLIFYDTNILIYAEARAEPQHEEAKSLRDLALTGTIAACISPQILSEFFSSVTHQGRRGAENPLTPIQAADIVKKYNEAADITIIYPGPQTIELMLAFLDEHPVSGANIHDLRIAATMKENGITKILTYDQGLFSQLSGISVVDPSELLSAVIASDEDEETSEHNDQPEHPPTESNG